MDDEYFYKKKFGGAEQRLSTLTLDIDEIIQENRFLRCENERLAEFEKLYNDLVMSSIKNSEATLHNWIMLCTSDKVKFTPGD